MERGRKARKYSDGEVRIGGGSGKEAWNCAKERQCVPPTWRYGSVCARPNHGSLEMRKTDRFVACAVGFTVIH